jgi:hypothetical protein
LRDRRDAERLIARLPRQHGRAARRYCLDSGRAR